MSARARALVLGLLSFAWTAACGSDFEPPSRIAKLRLLAVRADRPFARPGAEVRLEALAVDPAGRPLTWGWTTCVNPPASTVTACLRAADPAAVVAGAASEHVVRVPADAITRLPPGTRSGATVGVVVVVCPGALAAGGPGPVPFTCTGADGGALGLDAFEVGVKRIFVRDADENANPRIDDVRWDDAPWPDDEVKEATACADANDRFDACDEAFAHRIEVRSSLPETGVDELGVDIAEQQIIQVYATDGVFEHDVRIASDPATRWVGGAPTGAGHVTFWLLVRDNRGGVTWTTRRARVRAAR